MNPIAYHNTIAAFVESQKNVIEDYERRLAEANARAERAESELELLRRATAANGAAVTVEPS